MRAAFRIIAASLGLAFAATVPAAQERPLIFAHPFSESSVFARSCAQLALAIERETAGALAAEVATIELARLVSSLRSGAVAASCVPASAYEEDLPEAGVVAASNSLPGEVRRNGGMALLDRLHRDRLGLRYLGWIDSGLHYHIYLRVQPPLRDGLFDLRGLTLRHDRRLAPLLRALGAETRETGIAATFAAIDRRELDGAGWIGIGVRELKWGALLKHRTAPGVYQSGIGVLMNDALWTRLPPRLKQALERTVIAHEETSRNARVKDAAEEEAELIGAGLEVHALEPDAAAALLKLASDLAYQRIDEALRRKGLPLEPAQQLRRLYSR
jgi:TRAP-type C4-dicarboxylate transport system substrate-binding protein